MKPTGFAHKEYLLAPGPTPVPPAVLLAGALPMTHHRTPRFEALAQEVNSGLQTVFQTVHPVMTLAASGTGAMETALVNLLSPGDTAIVVSGGKFGERWTSLCKAYQVNAVVVKIPYGAAPNPELVRDALKANPTAKAVFTQLSETSTGCVYDIAAIGKIVAATDAVFVVDGISGVCAEQCLTDAWQIDVLLSGSQKGFMLPPGLAFISVSPKAWVLVEKSTLPKFYFDLKAIKKGLASGEHPWTPAVGLIVQLHKALELIQAETMTGMWARHQWLGDATRAGVKALGLELFAERPGNVLTAVKVPAGVDGLKIVKILRDHYGVTIAGGQGDEMKGKLFRIAHLGYMDRFDILTALSALEMTFKTLNAPVTFGASVAAASEILWKGIGV